MAANGESNERLTAGKRVDSHAIRCQIFARNPEWQSLIHPWPPRVGVGMAGLQPNREELRRPMRRPGNSLTTPSPARDDAATRIHASR